MMLHGFRFLLLFFCLSLAAGLTGQDRGCGSIRLVDVAFDDNSGFLDLSILARDRSCQEIEDILASDFRVFEQIENEGTQQLDIVDISFEPRRDSVDLKTDTVQVLFLVERSSRMNEKLISEQNSLIVDFLDRFEAELGFNSNYHVSTVGLEAGDFVSGSSKTIQRELVRLKSEPIPESLPDLYLSVITSLNRLEQLRGQKMVFLLASGAHQTNPNRYEAGSPRLAPELQQLEIMIGDFNNDLYFFPILMGEEGIEEEDRMIALADASITPIDEVSYGSLPTKQINDAINSKTRLIYTHRVQASTTVTKFEGEKRKYCMLDGTRPGADPESNCRNFRTGSFNSPKTASSIEGGLPLVYYGLGGLGGVLLLLAVFALLVPVIRQWQFRSRHVVAFQPQPGRTIQDPYTREPIREGEKVVNICRMPVPLATWRECNYQCPHYPNCTKNTLQCKGEGARENPSFFRATGTNRLLNWIWFGALGGLLGWLLFALVDYFLLDGTGSLGRYADGIIRRYTEGASADSLVRDVVIGVSFGTGLILLLSIMEERTQSRKFSYGRIIMRTLIGAMVSLVVFGGGFLLQATGVIAYPLAAAALTWIVFGVGVGTVLLVNSSITALRGVVGGMLASLLGFAVYWGVSYLAEDTYLAKLLALMLSGAVLGGVLDTVINLSEDYEMQYITPVEYSHQMVPLSKWLKSGWEIIIGTQPGCQVYIKWPDPAVEPEHAKIILEGGRVFLIPFAETLVNGRMTTGQKKTQLHDGDIIRLGRDSITEMRFNEKQKEVPAE